MQTKRILRVIHSLRRETGGPVAGLAETTPVLAEAGIASEFVVLDGVHPSDAPFTNYPVHVFDAGNAYGSCHEFHDWLEQHIAGFDAVFVHGCWKYHGVAVRRVARTHGVPYFLYPHGMLDPWFNKRYPLKWLKKQLYWWWREYAVVRDARAVLFTSQEEMRLSATAFVPYRASGKVVPYGTLPPNAANLDDGQRFRRKVGFQDGTPYLLYLGRIHEKKGIDLLIDAWKQWREGVESSAKDWQLVIAGPQGQENYESRLAGKRAGRSDIHRIDGLYDEDKWSALSGALALILPSHQENFGMVVAEALSAGTPVLLTRQVNIWREVVEGGAGIVSSDNATGVGTLLRQYASLPKSERCRIKESANVCFRKHFSIKNSPALFSELLKQNKH